MNIVRKVYIISDLHLGGRAKKGDDPGFRMMKHPDALRAFIEAIPSKASTGTSVELVVNGDFVDFLASEHPTGARWRPFAYERGAALRAFRTILEGEDAPVFDALAKTAKKCRVTIMLGNHDLELSLPEVRNALLEKLGDAPSSHVRFLYDGEALEIGDAVVEHGNAHDPSNAVDFDGLRYLRAIRSRGHYDDAMQRSAFQAPPGSQLVASLMNPLKERYAFIDLLKPESEPLFSLLLALEPDARSELEALARLASGIAWNLVAKPGFSPYLANVSASAALSSAPQGDALATMIARSLPRGSEVIAPPSPAGPQLTNVSAGSWLESKLGVLRSYATGGKTALQDRLPALRQAFRALEGDPTWNPEVEAGKRYRDAALSLAHGQGDRRGYRWVVFGHTHHAKRVELEKGGPVYLNSGTWANLMKFPVLPDDDVGAMATILKFAEHVKNNAFDAEDATMEGAMSGHEDRLRQIFHPTYVRLDVDTDGKVVEGALGTYDWKAGTFE